MNPSYDKRMEILLEDLDLIENRIFYYSDPLDEPIRRELQEKYRILDEERIRLTISEFRSKYDRHSVYKRSRFKNLKF